MTREEIISGLKFTVDMFLFDPSTGEYHTKPKNDMDKTTVDACNGAIELLEQEPKTGHWINVEVWDKERYACSVCQVVVNREPCYHYCPYCGAEMIEPKESEE